MISSLVFLFFLFGILTKSTLCQTYARQGLQIWFQSMIPALLPFMILSGIMIRTGISDRISNLVSPVFRRIFHCSPAACYCILTGFLCGFPMGAKTISDLYAEERLSEEESRWLLSFCNNIGPAYMTGFVIPLLHIRYPLLCIAVFYGVPLIYGWILGIHVNPDCQRGRRITPKKNPPPAAGKLFSATAQAVENGIHSITMLGGYTVLFCLLNLFPHWITGAPQPILGPLFEITSGLQALRGSHPLYCLFMLAFGGLCCIAQTFNCLKDAGLSKHLGEYCFHKLILSLLTLLCFSICQKILPEFF